jgi:23S rRNA pseudouridine1911/1915/1917 synthase
MTQIPFPILFEDEDILVVDKPSGVVVNSAESVQEETVQSWMKQYLEQNPSAGDWYSLIPDEFTEEYGSPQEIFASRNGIAHRLDKDTSGALILAKNPGALVGLMHQFKTRETHKEYTCLVHGKLPVAKDTIRMPIMRSTTNRSKFQVAASGRPSETEYEVIAMYKMPEEKIIKLLSQNGMGQGKTDSQLQKDYQSYGTFSLVRCYPKTGRTHQIRVHFAFLQHPLVADQVYTNKWRGRADLLWCSRQFLHASSITFQHPRSKEMLTVSAPLEQDLQQALEQLEALTT